MAASASSATPVTQERAEITLMIEEWCYGEDKVPLDPTMMVQALAKSEKTVIVDGKPTKVPNSYASSTWNSMTELQKKK